MPCIFKSDFLTSLLAYSLALAMTRDNKNIPEKCSFYFKSQ